MDFSLFSGKSRKSRKSRFSGSPEGAPIDHFLRGNRAQCPQKVWGPGNPISEKGLSRALPKKPTFFDFFRLFRFFPKNGRFLRFSTFRLYYTLKKSIPARKPLFRALFRVLLDANTHVLLYSVGSLRPTSMYTARDRLSLC